MKGFLYSAALKAKPGNWTDANLDAFLADPQGFAPGVGMDAAVQDPAQRRELIAYIGETAEVGADRPGSARRIGRH